MRIRWRRVARVAAVVVVCLIGLRLLPELLRAPQPPLPAADVGLPKAEPPARAPVRVATATRPRTVPDAPASTAVIGTRHRRRRIAAPAKPHRHHARVVAPTPSPVPEYVAPPPPAATPEPPPAPPPAPPPTPGDGSEEFAPH